MSVKKYKAALFDLDGVVFDTEPQYTVFWGGECRHYHPEIPNLEYAIKGQTLTEILENNFSEYADEWDAIVERLNDYESKMQYVYVDGFLDFIDDVRRSGLKTAVVTSSNKQKMEQVYASRPEMKQIFDEILTSEDFDESKPDPDCYLKAAERFGVKSEECIVFEDSFNGLRSGRASGAKVVGLSTSNPTDKISPLSDLVIADYAGLSFDSLSLKINEVSK